MLAVSLLLVVAVCICQGAPHVRDVPVENVDLLMPKVAPTVADTYLCTAMKMNSTPTYIVGFKPKAKKEIAHHILLYGCTEPGRREGTWDCGEMAHTKSSYASGPVCAEGSQIVYAWAMDAPELKLPEDVAFKVGGNTRIKYLVLQVHYKDVSNFIPPISKTDSSGVILKTTKEPKPNRAGVLLIGTAGSIPAHSVEYMEAACQIRTDLVLHPFAFRTHAHGLGQVISGYRIRDNKWTEIGKKSPKLPQMFYNTTSPGIDVKNGDIVAARCTMKNDLDHEVAIGSTQADEMCNFYMMYYVKGDRIYDQTYCFSAGPSMYYWQKSPYAKRMGLDNMPRDISVIPGTSKVLEKTSGQKHPILRDDVMVDRLLEEQAREMKEKIKLNRFLEAVNALNAAYNPEYKLYDNEY